MVFIGIVGVLYRFVQGIEVVCLKDGFTVGWYQCVKVRIYLFFLKTQVRISPPDDGNQCKGYTCRYDIYVDSFLVHGFFDWSFHWVTMKPNKLLQRYKKEFEKSKES